MNKIKTINQTLDSYIEKNKTRMNPRRRYLQTRLLRAKIQFGGRTKVNQVNWSKIWE